MVIASQFFLREKIAKVISLEELSAKFEQSVAEKIKLILFSFLF